MYQVVDDNTILRIEDRAFIPCSEENRDYRGYQEWLAEGNTPLPAPEPPPVHEPTLAEKLASVGLTLDELAAALASR